MKKRGVNYVYVLANKKDGVLYVGVTSDLIKRIYQHKNNLVVGFTQKYNVHKLVYYEIYNDIRDGIARETQLKRWKRQWKIDLFLRGNPEWVDLSDELNPV